MNLDSGISDTITEKNLNREREKEKKKKRAKDKDIGHSDLNLRKSDPITKGESHNMKEKGETLNHLPKNTKDGNRKESKKKESSSTTTSQMKGRKIVKSMGEVVAGHLKEIKDLEIVIETPRRSEKEKETKQRPQNTRRSVTERT